MFAYIFTETLGGGESNLKFFIVNSLIFNSVLVDKHRFKFLISTSLFGELFLKAFPLKSE